MADELKAGTAQAEQEEATVVVAETTKNDAPVMPSEAELTEQGLDPREIAELKESGMIGKPAEKKEDAPAADAAAAHDESKVADDLKKDLTPEQEKALLDGYSKPQKALYREMKTERSKRQRAEQALKDKQRELDHLELKLKAQAAQAADGVLPAGDGTAAEGDPLEGIDPDAVMTGQDVKSILKKVLEKQGKQAAVEDERTASARQIHETLKKQEEEIKQYYPDFDQTVVQARSIMDVVRDAFSRDEYTRKEADERLTEMFGGDRKKAREAKKRAVEFSRIAVQGGQNEFGETAAEVAYDLGKMLPGKESDAGSTSDTADDAPAQSASAARPSPADRAIANAQRGRSSAVLSGGGSRTVPLSKITLEDAARMPYSQFEKLPDEVIERLLKT